MGVLGCPTSAGGPGCLGIVKKQEERNLDRNFWMNSDPGKKWQHRKSKRVAIYVTFIYIRSSLIHSNLATKMMQTQACHRHPWPSENFHTEVSPQTPLAPLVAWVHALLVFPDIFKIDLLDFKGSIFYGKSHPKRGPTNPLGSTLENESCLRGHMLCYMVWT